MLCIDAVELPSDPPGTLMAKIACVTSIQVKHRRLWAKRGGSPTLLVDNSHEGDESNQGTEERLQRKSMSRFAQQWRGTTRETRLKIRTFLSDRRVMCSTQATTIRLKRDKAGARARANITTVLQVVLALVYRYMFPFYVASKRRDTSWRSRQKY